MKHPYLILAIILMVTLLLIFDRLELKSRRMRDGEAPPDRKLPGHKVTNDKLIVVEGMHEDLLKKMLRDFCGWYNREMLQVIPAIIKITGPLFAITFPYDVSFEIFCSLVNYLNYPKGYNRRFDAMGWTTTRSAEMWVTDDLAGKQVLLFVPDDMEYDSVFMTTADQIGYKLDFGGQRAQLLEHPGKQYHMPPFTTEDLADKETVAVDFEGK